MSIEHIVSAIRDVPDFPKPGIVFKDITPVLSDPVTFKASIDVFADRYRDQSIASMVGIDARGFIFGAAVADRLGIGFIPIRKKGKLPSKSREVSYDLEYGSATIEIHEDAIQSGQRVVLIDDLLATGGTAAAGIELLQGLEAEVVEAAFLVELGFLDGRIKLGDTAVFSPIIF